MRSRDQTVAEDYFAAMERVEKRLEIAPEREKEPDEKYENVKVLDENNLFELTEKLAQPKLDFEERLVLVGQLKCVLGVLNKFKQFEVIQTVTSNLV